MDDLIKKLSSYNIFNHLIPGAAFAVLGETFTTITFIHEDILVSLFVFYTIGLIVSRIGSLVIQPPLEWLSFIKPEAHARYVDASKIDEMIPVLSEQNNMYRTLAAMVVALAVVVCYDQWLTKVLSEDSRAWVVMITLFTLFLFSYRKQTKFIVSRINRALDEDND